MLPRPFRSRTALASTLICALLVVPTTALGQPAPEAPAATPKLTPPELVENVEPVYPESKKAAHESADVELKLTVDESGAVTDVEVTRSAGDAFDEAAIAAARQLKFKPATRDGSAIAARIPFHFAFQVAEPAPEPEPAPRPAPSAPAPAPAAPASAPLPTSVTDVEVVGERAPREVTRRAVDQHEIRSMPGTNGDALRSLESMPGVARPPAGAGMLLVRGAGPDDTAVFVDGTAVPIAYHFGDFNSVVPSELLESIDFYPGNFGPEYGRALGGIVDIQLRSPARDRFHGMLQVDLIDARVIAEAPLGEHTRALIAGRRSWIDAWIGGVLEQDGSIGVTKAPVYYDYQGVIEQDLSKSTTARLAVFGSDDRMRLVVNAPNASDPSYSGGFEGGVSFIRAQLRTDTRFGSDARWVNTLSVGRDTQRFAIGRTFGLDVAYNPVALRSEVKSRVASGVTAVAGFDVVWSRVHGDRQGPPMQDQGQDVGPEFARPQTSLFAEATRFLPAAYAMLELSPASNVKLMPGVRADHTSDIHKTSVDPRFSARWDVAPGFPRTTLKGGVGIFHQAPQVYQSIAPFGTPTLRHERAIHYDLGFEQELGRNVELSVDGFYKHFDELVVERPDALNQSGTQWSNDGTGRAYGAELLLRYKNDKRFFGWVAYTLSRSERRDAAGEPYRLFDYDQTHILTAVASYKLGRGWELGARWRYVSGNPYTPVVAAVYDADAGAYQASDGAENSARDPAFHRLDVRVEKTWTFTDWKLSAYLDVQNAYNRKNAEGRSYNYNYSRSDVASGLPILPVVGLRGEL